MIPSPSTIPPVVRFDPERRAIVVQDLVLTEPGVVHEARHWTTGQRGSAVTNDTDLAEADLSDYLAQVVLVGSRGLAAMGETVESRVVEHLLHEVGQKTEASTGQAAELTRRSVQEAAEAIEAVATTTRKTLTETEERTRTGIATAVEGATTAITAELERVLGGQNPELVQKLKPLLDGFGTQVNDQARAAFDSFVVQAGKQLDPADPTSPMAKLGASLAQQQKVVMDRFDAQYTEVATAVTDLTAALRKERATSNVVQLTTLKGRPFEDAVGTLLQQIAAGLGDEYESTRDVVGLLPRNKKGDGVLHVDGVSAGVVIEMSDSGSKHWGSYLDDAERNRGVTTSLGIVRFPEQIGGEHVRVLGSRRVLLAFDPETDDPSWLRLVVQLLRAAALSASGRHGAADVATADEHITAAIAQLGLLESIKKAVVVIQKKASDIDGDAGKVAIGVQRHLDLAAAALTGLASDLPDSPDAALPGVA